MPPTVREYLYAILISATAILAIVGAIAFWGALSLEGYLIAGCIFGVAALAYVCARRLEPKRAVEDLGAFADYMGGKKTSNKQGTHGN